MSKLVCFETGWNYWWAIWVRRGTDGKTVRNRRTRSLLAQNARDRISHWRSTDWRLRQHAYVARLPDRRGLEQLGVSNAVTSVLGRVDPGPTGQPRPDDPASVFSSQAGLSWIAGRPGGLANP